MALLFVDGFDHYDTATSNLQAKWEYVNPTGSQITVGTSPATRYGFGQQMQIAAAGLYGVRKNLGGNYATVISGFGFRTNSFVNTTEICSVWDNGTEQASVRMTGSGQVYGTRLGTTLGSASTYTMPVTTWIYLEVKFTIDPSAGVIVVKANGTTVLNLTGQNTRNTANSYATQFALGTLGVSATITYQYDDCYVCSGTGGVNDDFLGEVRVVTLYPDGSGTNTGFIKGGSSPAATNWQSVDEATQNSDVDYVAHNSPGTTDSYSFGSLPTNATTVKGVAVSITMRRDDVGSRTVAARVETGGSGYDVGSLSPGSTYGVHQAVMDVSPNTSAAWTVSNVNDAEFGLKVTA